MSDEKPRSYNARIIPWRKKTPEQKREEIKGCGGILGGCLFVVLYGFLFWGWLFILPDFLKEKGCHSDEPVYHTAPVPDDEGGRQRDR